MCNEFSILTINNKQLFQLKLYDKDFGIVVGESISEHFANSACQQQGFQKATLPLKLLPALSFKDYFRQFYTLKQSKCILYVLNNLFFS